MTETRPDPASPGPASPGASPVPGRRALIGVLSANMLLDALEVSVVIAALPSVAEQLELSPTAAQWLMSAFALGFAAVLAPGVRLSTRLGRRRTFLGALALFALASALAPWGGTALLVASRLVKGMCAGLTAPLGLAIIAAEIPEGEARRRAVTTYSLFGAVGFSVGLVLSGVLTSIDWRITMLFAAPVALVLAVVGARVLPSDPPRAAGPRGAPRRGRGRATALGTTVAAACVVASVTGSPVADAAGRVLLAAVGLLGAAVVAYAAPRPAGAGPRRRTALTAAGVNGSYWGLLFTIVFLVRDAGHPAWVAAAVLLPAPLLLALGTRWAARWSCPRVRVTAGVAAVAAGHGLVAGLTALGVGAVLASLAGLVLVGLGLTACFAALIALAVEGMPDDERADAVAGYQTAVQIGGAVVLAVVAAVGVVAGPVAAAAACAAAVLCGPAAGRLLGR